MAQAGLNENKNAAVAAVARRGLGPVAGG